MRDLHVKKPFPRIPREHQEGAGATFFAFIAAIICISLMSWSCVDRYAQKPLASTYIDKDILKLNTKESVERMKEDTAKFNEQMERIVAEGAKK